jgi:flagellar basal-body rod protein FlgB
MPIQSSALNRTHKNHIQASNSVMGGVMYRNPQQPSLDGNTVETHIEQGKFAENSVQYQASLTFLKGKFAGLRSAISGK